MTIHQSDRYLGVADRWEWSVWLEGEPADLDGVDRVQYILHPTFQNPVREVRERGTNFRLSTSGWGTFTIHARVFHKDGQISVLNHDLVLHHPDAAA